MLIFKRNISNDNIILFIVLLLGCGILAFDYNKLELKYITTINMAPPISTYKGQSFYAFFVHDGENLKEYIEKNLFEKYYINPELTVYTQPEPVTAPYKITWPKTFKFENSTIYYVCIGCEINEITYFYHSKDIMSGKETFRVLAKSLRPLKDKSIIKIYEGDVRVLDF